MSRRSVSGLGTSGTALLVGAGLLAVYLLMKNKTVTAPTTVTVPAGGTSSSSNTTNTAINDATSVVNNILGLFS